MNLDRITKYEKTRLIGLRALQISSGSPSTIKVPKDVTNALDIAELEYLSRRLPLKIKRKNPDGTCKIIAFEDIVLN